MGAIWAIVSSQTVTPQMVTPQMVTPQTVTPQTATPQTVTQVLTLYRITLGQIPTGHRNLSITSGLLAGFHQAPEGSFHFRHAGRSCTKLTDDNAGGQVAQDCRFHRCCADD